MKINELKTGTRDVNITAKVKEVKEPREVTTKFGTRINLTEVILEDDSGTIKLTLWGKQADGMETGKDVEVAGGFVKEFRGELQLGVGKGGSVKVV